MGDYQLLEGYKRTEIGIFPENWMIQSVGEAFEIRNNLRLPINRKVRETMEGQYPYYGPTNVQGYINEYRIEGEHALIGEDGDHFLKWRDTSMTLLVDGKFNVNNHAHIVRGVENLTSWFYYFFSHKELTTHLTRQGAGRYKLTKSALTSIVCAIPPLPEQRAIAQALSDVDALIAALDKLIAKKRDLKTATMQQLLTGKNRLPGFGEGQGCKESAIGLIPEDWDVYSLSQVCSAIVDGTHYTPSYVTDGVPFYSVENVTANDFKNTKYISNTEHLKLIKRCKPEKGDLLLTRIGSLGVTKLIDWNIDASIYVSLALLKLNEKAYPSYVYAYSKSEQFLKNVEKRSLTNATPQKINMGDIGNVPIPIPSNQMEQRAIATVLSDMDTEITALESRLVKTQAIKQGMMQELLTGRTRLV